MAKRTCKSCKYFHHRTGELGECRINPPTFVEFSRDPGDLGLVTRFPEVSKTEWCGKFTLEPELPEIKLGYDDE